MTGTAVPRDFRLPWNNRTLAEVSASHWTGKRKRILAELRAEADRAAGLSK